MDTPYTPDDPQQPQAPQQSDPYVDAFANADNGSVKAMTDSLYREAPASSLVTRDPGQRKTQSAVHSLYDSVNKKFDGYLTPILRGATKGYNELGRSVAGGMAYVGSKLGASEDSEGMKQLRTIQRDGMVTARAALSALGPDTDTGLHAFVRDATQFMAVNEVLGGSALAGEATGAVKWGIHAARSAAADAVGFDPRQARLSNLLENAPLGIGSLAAKLAADPNDGEATARFKAALEGVALSSTIEAAVHGLKSMGGNLAKAYLKPAAAAAEEGAPAAAPKLADFAQPDAAPAPDAFITEPTPMGQVRVVPRDAAAAAEAAKIAPHPTFDTPEQAESVAASLSFAQRNAARPKDAVTPEQAGYLKSLAQWIHSTGNYQDFQNGTLDIDTGERVGGAHDVNFAYDLEPDQVGHMISAMSTVFRKEMEEAKLPQSLMRDPEGGAVISHAETVAKAAQDYSGTTPEAATSRFHQIADAMDEAPAAIVAAKVLRQNIAQSAEQLARAMDAAPDNIVAHGEFIKATNALLNTFTAERRLLSGSGRALNAGQIRVGANGAAVDAEALGRSLRNREVDPRDVINFKLVDEPLEDSEIAQMDKESPNAEQPAGETAPAAPTDGTTPPDAPPAEEPATGDTKPAKPTINVTPRQLRAMARQMMFSPRNAKEQEDVLKAVLGMARKATESGEQTLPSTWDKITGYRRWSMLSAPTTPEVNFFSAVGTALYRPMEGMLGGAAQMDPDKMRLYGNQMIGTLKAFRDSMEQAKLSWESGSSRLTARDPSVPQVGPTDTPGIVNKMLGFLKVNERLMTSGDEFAQQIAYRGHVYAQSLENAKRAGITDPTEIAQRVGDDINAAFNSAGQGQNPSAVAYAQDVTMRRQLDYGVGKWIEDGAKDIPAIRVLFPFTRIPANIARYNLDRAPLGMNLLTRRNMEDWAAGGSQRDDVISRTVAGNMVWGMAALMHHSGMMTGGGPKDPELRRQWMNVYQPYSIKMPGSDQWVSYRRFEPLSTPLGIVSDFMDMMGEMKDGGDTAKAIDGFAAGVASNLMSKAYLKSMSDFFYAMGSGKTTAMDSFVDGVAGSFVPNIVQKANPDDTLRATRDFIDRLQSRIPGFSEELEPRRNIYGEKVLKPGNQFQRMFNPFTVRADKADPVDVELLRLGAGMSMPVPRKYGVDLQDRSLGVNNQSPYDRWMELMSQPLVDGQPALRDALREFVQSDRYKSLTDGTEGYKGSRLLAVESMVRGYRQAAFAKMVQENPKVLQAIQGEAMKRGAALSDDPDVTQALTGHSTDEQLRGHAGEAAALLGQP